MRLIGLLALFVPLATWSCNDPLKHTEWGVFYSMVEALGKQDPISVQMMYKIGDDRAVDRDTDVMLSFWPREPYNRAEFTVVPSDGLRLVDFSGEAEVPKGKFMFMVRPFQPGFHHLRVTLTVVQEEATKKNTYLLPVPVKLEHSPLLLDFTKSNRPSAAEFRIRRPEL